MLANLKTLRKETGISQQRLAEALGISQQSVNQYENHKVEPDIATLSRLADYFHTSVDYLIGRTENRWTMESLRENRLDPGESEMIRLYRMLNRQERDCVVHVMTTLANK